VVIGIRPAGEPPPKGQYRAETKSGSLFVPGTRRLRLRCTYCTTPIKLPWVVHVYGLGFRRGYVSPNGNLQFDTESASEDFDYCLPSPLIGTAIAPYWAQLYMDKGSGIWTRVLGKKPHRRFVLEWRHIAMWLRGAMTFEILLREDSTTVATIYGPGTWSFNNRGFAAGVQQEGGRGFCSRFEPVQGLEIDYVWQRG